VKRRHHACGPDKKFPVPPHNKRYGIVSYMNGPIFGAV
jgi:hypothetical protein